MDTIKEILTICNDSFFYDYSDIKNINEFNRLRKYKIKFFQNDIPEERLLISLYRIDNIILKIFNNEKDEIIDNFIKLREQIFYMLSFQKTIKDNQRFFLLLKNIYNHLLILYLLSSH